VARPCESLFWDLVRAPKRWSARSQGKCALFPYVSLPRRILMEQATRHGYDYYLIIN